MTEPQRGSAALPALWSRRVRRVVGWLLVITVVLPTVVGGAMFVVDALFG